MADSTAFEQSHPLNVGMLLYPNFTLLDLLDRMPPWVCMERPIFSGKPWIQSGPIQASP